MSEERFTLEQIKTAFWAEFHKSGERWFDYLGGEEACARDTEGAWRDFVEALRTPPTPDDAS